MTDLQPYLQLAVTKKASDLYFSANAPAMIRVEGEMSPITRTPLPAGTVQDLIHGILTPEQREELERHREVDFALSASGLGRFRVNAFYQRGFVSMVMRYVPSEVPRLNDLGVPTVLKDFALLKRGLVLLVGPTGCGKSTTLAAMIRHRNETQSGHILSVEDPIEYVHPNVRALISQREVGLDTESYERALVSAMREAPDVVYLGEIRRRQTMERCMQLANTGHLVLSTLHANNASQAMQRIVNFFPGDQRDQLYLDLSLTLRAVVSQRLVLGLEKRRVAASEILINTPYIAELILSHRIEDIPAAMAQGQDHRMQTFEDSLYALYKTGAISKENALTYADSRSSLEARISFGS
ncbi:MAG TPA: PilT/PilU family type 4a pilus ATPase [Nevskiaceae bacterium]